MFSHLSRPRFSGGHCHHNRDSNHEDAETRDGDVDRPRLLRIEETGPRQQCRASPDCKEKPGVSSRRRSHRGAGDREYYHALQAGPEERIVSAPIGCIRVFERKLTSRDMAAPLCASTSTEENGSGWAAQRLGGRLDVCRRRETAERAPIASTPVASRSPIVQLTARSVPRDTALVEHRQVHGQRDRPVQKCA